MYKRMLLIVALLFSSACHSTPPTQIKETREPILGIDEPFAKLHMVAIRDVHCGFVVGTANYINPKGILLTAAHVVGKNKVCTDVITGQKMNVYYVDEVNDIALLSADTKGDSRFMSIDCNGFVTGKSYISIGYAHGYDLRIDLLKATKKFSDKTLIVKGLDGKDIVSPGFRLLEGSVISGMSGGAIIDLETWKIVGINNISDIWSNAYSKELKDTVLCKR